MTHSLYLNWAVKRQYPNIKLDASLTNYKKPVLAKFDHQGLKRSKNDILFSIQFNKNNTCVETLTMNERLWLFPNLIFLRTIPDLGYISVRPEKERFFVEKATEFY